MTSFDPLHPNTGAIVELLSEHKALSTKDLMRLLQSEKGITISHANFYKILNKMLSHQMLVKSGDTVSFNMAWATYVQKCVAKMQDSSGDGMTPFPPFKDGERRIFRAESIEKVDPIWTHLILHFFTQEDDPTISVYESHPWFILGRPETERRMYDSCDTRGKNIQILYGNTTFLDQYGYKLHKTSPCDAFITGEPPFPDEAYNLWLCGDYIIECIFPDLIAQYFAGFFETIERVKDFDLQTFSSIFEIKIPVELIVSRDAKKAAKMRKSFVKFCT